MFALSFIFLDTRAWELQAKSMALAIFDETTYAEMQSCFQNKSSASSFLKIFDIWWTISNSKTQCLLRYYLRNVAVPAENKASFLRAMIKWL